MDHLLWDPRIDESNIQVKVNEDSIELSGSVPSHSQKIFAEQDTKEVGEISQIINNIAVEFSPEFKTPSDEQIERGVKKIFKINSCLDSKNIEVLVNEGKVTLKGIVNSYWEKEMATELTSDIPGIISLENHLAVQPPEPLSDEEIREDIQSAMERAVRVNSENVKIEVENGIVTLSGTVSSMSAYSAAQKAAKLSKGVIDIHNNLDYVLRYDTT